MVEEARYEVIRTQDGAEIRRYSPMVLATIYDMGEDAFNILFNYITGSNRARKRIDMTAPVISSENKGQEIQMTAPVISRKTSFSFVLPSGYSLDNAPEPLDDRIKIEQIKERKIAVLRFRGRSGEKRVRLKTEELLAILRKNEISVVGEAFLMRYNPPFIPGFMRRNEIGIETA